MAANQGSNTDPTENLHWDTESQDAAKLRHSHPLQMHAVLGHQVRAPRAFWGLGRIAGFAAKLESLEMAFVAVPALASRSLTDFAQSDLGTLAACCCCCQQVWLDGLETGWMGSMGMTGMTGCMRLALCQAWEAPLRAVPMSISLGHRRLAGAARAAGLLACWPAGVARLAEPARRSSWHVGIPTSHKSGADACESPKRQLHTCTGSR